MLDGVSEMDWEKIDIPPISDPASMPKSGKLSPLDYWKLFLASVAIRKSIAQVLQTAVLTYLDRNWEKHEERLEIEARHQNMTLEEYIQKLIDDELDRQSAKKKKH